MNGRSLFATALLAAVLVPSLASAHCQVPCGIYDDAARITLLFEDTTTIGKAVIEIKKLGAAHDADGQNQLTRWIVNKEKHASNVITVMAEYFLAQRVKPVADGAEGYEDYVKKLAQFLKNESDTTSKNFGIIALGRIGGQDDVAEAVLRRYGRLLEGYAMRWPAQFRGWLAGRQFPKPPA